MRCSIIGEFRCNEKRGVGVKSLGILHNTLSVSAVLLKSTFDLQCSYCLNEAQYNCCWNANYCNETCQQNHWPEHSTSKEYLCNYNRCDKFSSHYTVDRLLSLSYPVI